MIPAAIASEPLVDRFARVHDNLRISVTDKCNIRCFYCMPDGPISYIEHREILRYEEIEAGVITHALRFTAAVTRRDYVWPARRQAGATQPSAPSDAGPCRSPPSSRRRGWSSRS